MENQTEKDVNFEINNLTRNFDYRKDLFHDLYNNRGLLVQYPDFKEQGITRRENYSIIKCEYRVANYALQVAYFDVFKEDVKSKKYFNPHTINDDIFISPRELFDNVYNYLVKQFTNLDKLEVYQNDLDYLLKKRRFGFLESKENQLIFSDPKAINDSVHSEPCFNGVYNY